MNRSQKNITHFSSTNSWIHNVYYLFSDIKTKQGVHQELYVFVCFLTAFLKKSFCTQFPFSSSRITALVSDAIRNSHLLHSVCDGHVEMKTGPVGELYPLGDPRKVSSYRKGRCQWRIQAEKGQVREGESGRKES